MKITCSICFEWCTHDSISVAGTCGHLFHTICLENWFKQVPQQKSCPQCRRSTKEAIKLFIEEPSDSDSSNKTQIEFNKILDDNEKLQQEVAKLKLENTEAKMSVYLLKASLQMKTIQFNEECKQLRAAHEKNLATIRKESEENKGRLAHLEQLVADFQQRNLQKRSTNELVSSNDRRQPKKAKNGLESKSQPIEESNMRITRSMAKAQNAVAKKKIPKK